MAKSIKSKPDPHHELAKQLIQHHFGNKKVTVEPLSGGLTNFVYSACIGNDELVVRMSEERDKINFFLKEQWAIARAVEMGIPVPEVLEVGNSIIPIPYMIQKKVEGEEATHHTERANVLQELGHYAAIIHTIETTHFGNVFDWSQNMLSKNETWKDYLQNEFKANERLASLIRHKMIPPGMETKIRRVISKMEKIKRDPCLHHGDLRLKNVMVNKEGVIVSIIDWENCISSIAPYWDISIALHDLSIDKQGYFLEGYGMSGNQTLDAAPFIKVFNILNYAPVIDGIVKEKQKGKLEHYRARLKGALDMYSL